MNYKALFNRVSVLLSSPAKAWVEIDSEKGAGRVMSEFVYPLIGLCGLAVFIGTFLGNTAGVGVFPIAMQQCCAVFVALFGGFFLSSFLVNRLGMRMFELDDQFERSQQLVGYSMVVLFSLHIVCGLLSIDLLRWILQFYTLFVVYEGARTLMRIPEEQLTRYTLIVSLIILVCPALLGTLFSKLSVVLS